jgi:hypothetical protein
MVHRKLWIPQDQLGSVRFSWIVPKLIAQADMALRDADDSPARIVLAFEGNRGRCSMRDAMLSELSLANHDPLPQDPIDHARLARPPTAGTSNGFEVNAPAGG